MGLSSLVEERLVGKNTYVNTKIGKNTETVIFLAARAVRVRVYIVVIGVCVLIELRNALARVVVEDDANRRQCLLRQIVESGAHLLLAECIDQVFPSELNRVQRP